MKPNLLWSAVALLTVSALAAESSSKDTVKNAAKKLAEQASYSWRTTVETASDSRFRPGPTEGKTEKDGYTCLAMSRGENTLEAVMKGEKVVIKTDEGWQTMEDLTAGGGGQGNPARFMARTLRNYRLPATHLEDLVAQVKDLALADGAYAGELTEEGVRQLLTFGRRAGAEPPPISNAKGSVKIWLKDGLPAKYEVRVQGTITFNNNEMNVDRTTTTEIKEVGKTKVDVPAEAKAKLS